MHRDRSYQTKNYYLFRTAFRLSTNTIAIKSSLIGYFGAIRKLGEIFTQPDGNAESAKPSYIQNHPESGYASNTSLMVLMVNSCNS